MPVAIAQLPVLIERSTANMLQKRLAYDVQSPEEQKENSERLMAKVDALPQELRALVHEYGYVAVRKYIAAGMSPRAIRFSIEKNHEDWRALQEQQDREEFLANLELEL